MYILCREVRHEFFVYKLIQRKAVAALVGVVEVGDICHHARVYLHLHVVDGGDVGLLLDVGVLKVHALHIAARNDIRPGHKGTEGDERGGIEVRTEQALKAHAR